MKPIYKFLFIALLVGRTCHATLYGSSGYIANNTPYELRINSKFAGSLRNGKPFKELKQGKDYETFATVIKPWQRAQVIKLDRYPPMGDAHTAFYFFEITAQPFLNGQPAGPSIALKQQLRRLTFTPQRKPIYLRLCKKFDELHTRSRKKEQTGPIPRLHPF